MHELIPHTIGQETVFGFCFRCGRNALRVHKKQDTFFFFGLVQEALFIAAENKSPAESVCPTLLPSQNLLEAPCWVFVLHKYCQAVKGKIGWRYALSERWAINKSVPSLLGLEFYFSPLKKKLKGGIIWTLTSSLGSLALGLSSELKAWMKGK